MTLLAQQELLESPPSRRLIVPRGFESWWGCDPSTLRCAISGVSRLSDGDLGRWVKTCSFGAETGAQRLSEVYRETRALVESVATCCSWPGVVWVEQPGGSQRNWPLYYAVGVTITAIHDGLREVTGRSVPIETVVPAAWKKRACGRGDIYKPKKGDAREYGVLKWARLNGYDGLSWDEADAWAIAEAARRTVALEPR